MIVYNEWNIIYVGLRLRAQKRRWSDDLGFVAPEPDAAIAKTVDWGDAKAQDLCWACSGRGRLLRRRHGGLCRAWGAWEMDLAEFEAGKLAGQTSDLTGGGGMASWARNHTWYTELIVSCVPEGLQRTRCRWRNAKKKDRKSQQLILSLEMIMAMVC